MFIKSLSILGLITFTTLSVKAQQYSLPIDVQHYTFNIVLNDQNDQISGNAGIAVKFLKDADHLQLDLVKKRADGKGMTVLSVKENNNPVKFTQDSTHINIVTAAKANTVYSYEISYEGIPADGLIIATNKYGKRTFFGDNWPNRAQNWLPCNDHPSDKATVDFLVTAPDHYQVVANGLKVKETKLPDHQRLTHWHEDVALPTKVIVIGVSEFAVERSGAVNGTPVYSYVYPENKDQGFKDYALANKILPFYIKNIGDYPYKKLANVQSKTIFGGMENAGAIFYFENSVGDKGIESLMAHEIAHQWFGDAVTETDWQHVWLSEGFATYMTDCYLEHTYGIDSLHHLMQQQRKKIFAFEHKRLTPVIDSAVKSNYMQILNANSYEKGAWTLHMLRREIGDAAFWNGIREYYAQYNGRNANTDHLKKVMEKAAGEDLEQFFNQWLKVAGHPQLTISTRYREDKNMLAIRIEQKQAHLYHLSVEYKINGRLNLIDVKDKAMIVMVPLHEKLQTLEFDPDVNLLADIELKQF